MLDDFSAGSADAEQRAAVKGDRVTLLASQDYDLSLEIESGRKVLEQKMKH